MTNCERVIRISGRLLQVRDALTSDLSGLIALPRRDRTARLGSGISLVALHS